MDKLLSSLKSVFITAGNKQVSKVELTETSKPAVSEKQDAARASSAGKSTSTSPGTIKPAPAVTTPPQMTRSSASKEQSSCTTSSFSTAVRNDDLEQVRKHLEAGVDAGVAFQEAVSRHNEKSVELLLPHMDKGAKLAALKHLISTAKDGGDMAASVDIGSLILSKTEDPFLSFIKTAHAKAQLKDDEVAETAAEKLWSRIENAALCRMAADGDARGVKQYLEMAGLPNIDIHREPGEPSPLAVAAKNNQAAIVNLLLPIANEETKVDALVQLTTAACDAYRLDPFIATGRMLYKSLETPESSFATVRSWIEMAHSEESSMAPGFLHNISRN